VLLRGILLVVIGLIYFDGFTNPWPDMRLMGVLVRIGLCYTFGGLLFCFFSDANVNCDFHWAAGWLLALLTFVPFPDVRPIPGGDTIITKEAGFTNVLQLNMTSTNLLRGSYIQGVNLTDYLDQKYLPAANTTALTTRKAF
jgi:predicted acyltransferase